MSSCIFRDSLREGVVLDITTGPLRRSAAAAPAFGYDRVAPRTTGKARAAGKARGDVENDPSNREFSATEDGGW